MDIAEVRAKFPQYNDMSDADLAQALHKKYYADIPFDQFAGKIGLKGEQADPVGARPQPATRDQKIVASYPMRVARGMTDALDAGAQYLPWALGAVTGGFGAMPNKVSDFFFNESDRVSKGITEREKYYQDARKAVSGDVGFDSARFSGNVLSPINAAMAASGAPMPATIPGQMAMGAGLGGAGAITTPVYGADSTTLGGAKAGQAAVGAATGAVLTPIAVKATDVLGKGLDKIITAVRGWMGKSEQVPEQIIINTIRSELAKENISLDDVPDAILANVKKQVNDALAQGKKIDAAALVRKADFEAVGAKPLLGQITRDPVQFTREQNLRGQPGGEPIAQRINEQRQAFGQVFTGIGSSKADDAFTAGTKLGGDLAAADRPQKAAVDAAYQAVRDSAGRPAPMNTAQFSTLANERLDAEMLGGNLPTEARNLLNKVSKGEIPLDVQTQIKLRERLTGIMSDAYKAQNRQGALAVKQIIDALDATDVVRPPSMSNLPQLSGPGDMPTAGQATLDAAQQARKLAAERFGVIDKNPALKAFLEGKWDADTAVQKFVLNGKTGDLQQMAQILNPQGKETVRQQIAAHLERAAFGGNQTGDAAFAVERYNETLRKMGREKLSAFFTPQEIDQLYAVGRAAAWAGKAPAGNAVNWSNTGAAVGQLLGNLKGGSLAIPMAVMRPVQNSITINRGLLAQPPAEPIPTLAPALRELVPAIPLGAGIGAAGLLSQ